MERKIDYEKLEFLRKHTVINPIDYIKIHRLRLVADRTQILIN